jgi:hypothetical protein
MASSAAGDPLHITPSAAQVGIATGLAEGDGALDGLGVGESIGVGLALGLGDVDGDRPATPATELVPHPASASAAASTRRRKALLKAVTVDASVEAGASSQYPPPIVKPSRRLCGYALAG